MTRFEIAQQDHQATQDAGFVAPAIAPRAARYQFVLSASVAGFLAIGIAVAGLTVTPEPNAPTPVHKAHAIHDNVAASQALRPLHGG